jgi:hypothetical protein
MSKDQVVCQPFLMRQVYNYGLNFAQDVLSATKRILRSSCCCLICYDGYVALLLYPSYT